MEENKILYSVYYDPKLAHEFTGPSPPGCTLPPLNFRHTVQNAKRNSVDGGNNNPASAQTKVTFTEPLIEAPAKPKSKRKLLYSDNLVTFPVEPPKKQKKGKKNNPGRDIIEATTAAGLWALPSGGSIRSDFQEGSLSSFSVPSPIPYHAMPFTGQVKMEPPIDPLLAHGILPGTGNAKTDAILTALGILGRAGISPLELLLMILDPANLHYEQARIEFFDPRNHANIHALFTNLQNNARLRQDFQGMATCLASGWD
ncbi:hypothetical protein NMY22_g20024 [Coprinellus aureogranulatus]|nr:hypothetical protein NMY22_g20024 [Coprinellus aureogranulatus]